MASPSHASFEAISAYVGSHDNFTALPDSQKLQFYALYKAAHGKALSHGILQRLYLFCVRPSQYQRWLAWWVASERYPLKEAEKRYYVLARDLNAFPSPEQLAIMASGSSRGKGISVMVAEPSTPRMTSDMDKLIDACSADCVPIIADYLSNGGDVDSKNEEGISLLHFAVDANAMDIVKTLVVHGVDMHALDDQGLSALDSARLEGNEEMVQILTKGCSS